VTTVLPPTLYAPSDPAAPQFRLDTLPAGEPELTLGWEVIKWAVKWLVQPDGPHAGKRFEPTPRQVRFLLWWYALNPDGSWVFHHGVRRLAKGTGKSPGAAVWALIEFCGPARLKDFDPRRPGGCVGMPVGMPLVQIAAVSEQQTKNTMRFVRAFAPKGSRIVQEFGLDPGLTRYYKASGGELEVITSSTATQEGALATAIVGDETEWWLGQSGEDFNNTLADNAAKLNNRMLETCNAWKPGTHSVAEKTWDTWVEQEEKIAAGGTTKSGSMVLYDARVAPPDTDLADYDSLLSALQWVYEDAWWISPATRISRIWHKSSRPDDSKRKYLNWPTAAEGKWCDPQDWAVLAEPRELMDGERVVLFFDGSKSRDATACSGCCMSDGYVFTVGVWEPQDGVPVDAEQIDNRISAQFDRFDVVGFFADVREWEGYVKTTWPGRWKEQLDPKMWAVPSGKLPEPIAWDMRSHSREFALAAELVATEIEEKAFRHDGDAVVARHVGNAYEYETQWQGAISVRKETPNSPNKIDACVTVIGARMVYRLALAGSQPEEPSEAFAVKRW
jgi:hypothetical protein